MPVTKILFRARFALAITKISTDYDGPEAKFKGNSRWKKLPALKTV